MSLRLSAGLPRACSGLMYAAVPRMTPICVSAGLVIVGDSVTLATPYHLSALSPARSRAPSPCHPAGILMFAGFRSRWTIPCEWAASSASAICRAIGMASSNDSWPVRDPIGERGTLDKLEDQRVDAIGFFEAEN